MKRLIQFLQSDPSALRELEIIALAAMVISILVYFSDVSETIVRPLFIASPFRGMLWVLVVILMGGAILFAARRWREAAKAQEQFRNIFDRSVEGFFQTTSSGQYLSVNPALARMYGYDSPAELIAAVPDISKQYVDPTQRAQFVRMIEAQGEVRDFETRLRCKDGRAIWVLANARVVRDGNGKILYYEGNVQDITARKEAEEAYQRLVQQSLQAITIIQDGRIVFANQAHSDLLGYTTEEYLAMSSEQLYSMMQPEDRELVAQRQRDRLAGKAVPLRQVMQIRRKDGTWRWIEASIAPIDYRGKPALLTSMTDVTERKLAQDKMQETVQRTRMREEVSAALARAGNDLDQVLQTLARIVSRALGDTCIVWLVSADGKWVEPLAFAHARSERQAALRETLRGTRLTIDHPYLGHVITQGEPLFLPVIEPDVLSQNIRNEYRDYLSKFGVTSVLFVPIRDGGRVIGSLGVTREEGRLPYTAQDQILLQEFADRAALAITNAQLVSQLQSELLARREAEAKYRTLVAQIPEAEAAEREPASFAHAQGDAVALRNAQLLRQAQQRAAEFEALSEITQDLGRQSELPVLLELIVLRATELLHSPFGGVFLRDAASGELVLETARGGFVPAGQRVRPEEGLVGLVARTREPQTVYDYPNWERAVRQPDDYPEVYSLMGAPLLYTGELIGVLLVGEVDVTRRYSDDELRLLTLFAGQVASVVHNSRLFQETHQRAEQLALLYDVGLTLNRVLDERTQLEFLFKIARRALHADRMAFLRYQPASDTLEYELGVGLPTTLETYLHAVPVSVRLAEGLLGWVAHHRLPVRLGDVESDPRWKPVEPGEHSAIAVPVEHDQELRGVLIATSEQYDEFTPQDERMLILFSNQIAAAMELTRLFEAQVQRQREMEILREASVAFAASLDRDALLPAIVDYALRLVRGDNASLYMYENDCLVFGSALWSPESARPRTHFAPRPDGMTYRVARTGQRIIVTDAETDGLYQEIPWRGAIVGQPLRSGGRVLAVLGVAFAAPHEFDSRELHALDLLADQAAVAMENVRHLTAQQNRSTELEILREAGVKFAATLDREELISLILEYALRLVAADDAGFYLYENDTLTFGGIRWGKDGASKPPQWTPRPNGLTYTVARTGESIVIDEVNRHPMFADWQWGGAIVSLPLQSGGRVRAVLNIAYERPHRFEPEELRALQLLADQAAVALENARHAHETEQQLRNAQLLHRAGEALNHTHSFQEAANLLADFLQEAVAIDACCISILDQEYKELCVVVDHDPLPETRVMPGTTFPLSQYADYLLALEQHRGLIFRRDMPDLPSGVVKDMNMSQWQALLALPLFVGEQLLGIAELGAHNELRDFSPDQVRLAESLAYQGAAALQSAKLFEAAQRRAEQLALLNRIARGLSGARTLDELLDVIEHKTQGLLPCDSYYIALYDETAEEVDFRRFVDSGKRLAPFRWRLAPSLTRQVVTSGQALRLNEQCDDAPPENPPQFYGTGPTMRSWLGTPMRLGTRVLGVISLQTARPRAFDESDEQLLQTIADQAAVALERVRGAE